MYWGIYTLGNVICTGTNKAKHECSQTGCQMRCFSGRSGRIREDMCHYAHDAQDQTTHTMHIQFLGLPCTRRGNDEAMVVSTDLQDFMTGGRRPFAEAPQQVHEQVRVLQIGLDHPPCAGNHLHRQYTQFGG